MQMHGMGGGPMTFLFKITVARLQERRGNTPQTAGYYQLLIQDGVLLLSGICRRLGAGAWGVRDIFMSPKRFAWARTGRFFRENGERPDVIRYGTCPQPASPGRSRSGITAQVPSILKKR